jgi:hypothetical protein
MFLVRCYHRSLYAPKNCEWNQGLRSVDHCVECLCSLSGNPYSDGLASAALTLLVHRLRGVKKNPTDQDARTDCQLGIFQARGIWINVRLHNLHVFTIYLLPCTAHLHCTFALHIRPQSSLSLRQFRHVKVVPKWELHMPLATSWVLPLTSLTATPPVSLCLLCCGGTQRPETVECRVPRAENAWAGLPVIGVPCALKTIFALTKLTNLCRNVLNVLTCVHQVQNIQRTWVRHSSAMCDLSCSTSVLAHVVY